MARRVFFSFHYDRDVWRANQVRNCNVIAGVDEAGFFDHSEYIEAKARGNAAIKNMILRHLEGTSVTVVLIGSETAYRPWVRYEIEQSIARKNGLLGIYIHHLKDKNDQNAFFSIRGPRPTVPFGIEFPCYEWDRNLDRFRMAIEAAGRTSDQLLRAERVRAATRRW
jgi:hypothetical protein